MIKIKKISSWYIIHFNMFNDKTSLILGFAVIILLYYYFYDNAEHMAPLNYGTYKNDSYPPGGCNVKSLKRTDCMVGNCPLKSTVTDDQFCHIQSAQGIDRAERDKYFKKCKVMMEGCR